MNKRRRASFALAVMIAATIAGLYLWWMAAHWQPLLADFPFQGPGVSAEQGVVEWPVVQAGGATFAYATATMGATGRDAMFEANWRALYAAGLGRGALHIYSLCQKAVEQGNNFNAVVPRNNDALPAAIEIDFQPGCAARPGRAAVIVEVNQLLALMESHTGQPVLLKISRQMEQHYHLSQALRRPLWSMRNFFPPHYAARPWRLWQASDMRRVDGISTPVPWNVVTP